VAALALDSSFDLPLPAAAASSFSSSSLLLLTSLSLSLAILNLLCQRTVGPKLLHNSVSGAILMSLYTPFKNPLRPS
jgi:hypothetical protein